MDLKLFKFFITQFNTVAFLSVKVASAFKVMNFKAKSLKSGNILKAFFHNSNTKDLI